MAGYKGVTRPPGLATVPPHHWCLPLPQSKITFSVNWTHLIYHICLLSGLFSIFTHSTDSKKKYDVDSDKSALTSKMAAIQYIYDNVNDAVEDADVLPSYDEASAEILPSYTAATSASGGYYVDVPPSYDSIFGTAFAFLDAPGAECRPVQKRRPQVFDFYNFVCSFTRRN